MKKFIVYIAIALMAVASIIILSSWGYFYERFYF